MVRPVNSSTMTTSPLLDDIVDIALEQDMGLEGLVEVMQLLDAAGIIEIIHLEQLLAQGHALFGQGDLSSLFIHGVMLIPLEIAA